MGTNTIIKKCLSSIVVALSIGAATPLSAQAGWHTMTDRSRPVAGCWDPYRQRTYLSTATGTLEWDGHRLRHRDLGGLGNTAMLLDPQHHAIQLLNGNMLTTWYGTHWQRTTLAMPYQSLASAFDAHRQRLVVYTAFGEVHEWDGVAWSQPAVALAPPARNDPAFAYDPIGQRVLMFGGGTGTTVSFGDTWAWNGQWTQLTGSGPAPRRGATLAFDPLGQGMVLYGTIPGSVSTWRLQGDTWAPITTLHEPTERSRAVLVHDGAGMLLVGGAENRDDDAWRLQNGDWQRLDLAFTGRRVNTAAAWDHVRNQMVSYGGATPGAGTLRHDHTWHLPIPAAEPLARELCGMSWSPRDLGVLLFGGRSVGLGTPAILADTWTWNGSIWQLRQPVTSPPARHGMVLQPDPRGGVLMFGGSTATQTYGDQWYWDGVTWNQESPSPMPGAYTQLAGAVDAGSGDVFLGGRGTTSALFTWRWNGANWTQLPAAPVNFVVTTLQFAYEPSRQRILMWTPIGYQWSGTGWVPQTFLGMSSGAVFVNDPVRDRLLAIVPSATSTLVRVATSTPAISAPFGNGCALGTAPSLVGLGAPQIGSLDFELQVDAGTPDAPTFVLLGFEGTPLPIGLGCTLYVDALHTGLLVADLAARATMPLVIPFDPALRGVELAAQAAAFDPPRSLFGTVTTTPGLRISIGD